MTSSILSIITCWQAPLRDSQVQHTLVCEGSTWGRAEWDNPEFPGSLHVSGATHHDRAGLPSSTPHQTECHMQHEYIIQQEAHGTQSSAGMDAASLATFLSVNFDLNLRVKSDSLLVTNTFGLSTSCLDIWMTQNKAYRFFMCQMVKEALKGPLGSVTVPVVTPVARLVCGLVWIHTHTCRCIWRVGLLTIVLFMPGCEDFHFLTYILPKYYLVRKFSYFFWVHLL